MKIADGLRVTQLSLRCRHLTDSVSVTAAALVGGDGLVGGGALLRGAVRARGLARHRSGGRTGPRGTRVTADRLERPGLSGERAWADIFKVERRTAVNKSCCW